MMKSKYNIQVCWYVHSDQSSQSFCAGHCPIEVNRGTQDISVR